MDRLSGRGDGECIGVVATGAPQAVSAQADAAPAAVPGGRPVHDVAPRTSDMAVLFRVDQAGVSQAVVVDPDTATVLMQFPHRSGWYETMDRIHGELMLGVTGDRMVETAASPGIVMLTTGLYL